MNGTLHVQIQMVRAVPQTLSCTIAAEDQPDGTGNSWHSIAHSQSLTLCPSRHPLGTRAALSQAPTQTLTVSGWEKASPERGSSPHDFQLHQGANQGMAGSMRFSETLLHPQR